MILKNIIFITEESDDAVVDMEAMEDLKNELMAESNKETPDNARIAHLQRLTFSTRKMETSSTPKYECYPFLLQEKFVSCVNLYRPCGF